MDVSYNIIKTTKNLLAFSGGIDSSALFYLLLENNISFDIVIVDYNQREQSKDEIIFAQNLAKKYRKKIYVSSYNEEKFSEQKARDFRYSFFDTIISKHKYESLITGHQLNDMVEWFLMQFSKGAGLNELIGLQEQSKRKNYNVYRPLLKVSKSELEEYLKTNKLKYFIDESNTDVKYKRNYFRNEFSNKFVDEYKDGIKRSIQYMNEDIKSLDLIEDSLSFKNLSITKFLKDDLNVMIRFIDQKLKSFGIIISADTRDEIIKQKSIVILNRICIAIQDNYVWISPLTINTMDKVFKEECRVLKIPTNIRPYLFCIDKNEFDNFTVNLKIFN